MGIGVFGLGRRVEVRGSGFGDFMCEWSRLGGLRCGRFRVQLHLVEEQRVGLCEVHRLNEHRLAAAYKRVNHGLRRAGMGCGGLWWAAVGCGRSSPPPRSVRVRPHGTRHNMWHECILCTCLYTRLYTWLYTWLYTCPHMSYVNVYTHGAMHNCMLSTAPPRRVDLPYSTQLPS